MVADQAVKDQMVVLVVELQVLQEAVDQVLQQLNQHNQGTQAHMVSEMLEDQQQVVTSNLVVEEVEALVP